MREDKIKTEEGAVLWRRARQAAAAPSESEAPQALWLAAYLDGRLAEDEAARLEARLARDPALLDELLALRATLDAGAAGPEEVPAAVVARAQALRDGQQAARPAAGSWFGQILGAWLRPAVPAFAAVALLLACAGAFELGRYQGQQMETTPSAEVAESDVPVDLLMEDLI
jgi:anti-sigma factor RsiW